MAETPKKQLTALLQDVRKLRRSVRLRKESDPELVANILETIMKEAIILRSYNSGRLGKGAVNELRNIRRDLVAGNINAGGRENEFVGKYSAILDQIDKIEAESGDDSSSLSKSVVSSISNSLPSAEALTAALMTANPVLGYTTKIARDLLRARKQAKDRVKSKQEERIAKLNKEQAEAEAALAEYESSGTEMPLEEIEEISYKLDLIKFELENLARIWGDDRETNLEKLEEEKETASSLEKLTELEQKQNDREKKKEDMQEFLERESLLEGETKTPSGLLKKDNDTKGFSLGGLDLSRIGLASGLGGAIGSIAASILKPFAALFAFLKAGSIFFAKYAAIGTLAVSIFNGFKGFFDGLFNTAEILGKEEGEEITLLERFRAARIGMWAGLLSPINWILNKFGMGFAENEKDIQQKIIDLENKAIDFIKNIPESLLKFFSIDNFQTNIVPAVEKAIDTFMKKVLGYLDMFSESIFGISVSGYVTEVKDAFLETIENFTKKFTDFFKNIFSWATDKYEGFKDGVSSGIESAKSTFETAKEKTGDFLSETGASIRNFFNFNEDKSVMDRLEETPNKLSSSLTNATNSFNTFELEHSVPVMQMPPIIAPSSVTNVRSTNIEVSTGARNNDSSLTRVRQRQKSFGIG